MSQHLSFQHRGPFPTRHGLLRLTALGPEDNERLLNAIVDLSRLRDLDGVMAVVRRAARDLTGADGVTFVLRERDVVYYADEDAIGPLWKGRRFPATACISGWAIQHRETVVLEDIYEDPRIPADAYRPTFVKSLAMVPIRSEDPIGAIGAYWATRHRASPRELTLLQALANAAAVAVANAELHAAVVDATRAREDFLLIASHELRTPLTSLLLQLETLGRGEADGGTTVAVPGGRLAVMRRGAKRLHRLVEQLLSTAELLNGTLGLRREEVDLGALARDVVDRFADLAAHAGSTVHVVAPTRVVLAADRRRLDVALGNLLSNALKYGEGKPVEVRIERSGASVRLTVRDHGIGIDPRDHTRIFGRFERAVPPNHYGGFGLGLWAARQMVEVLGGRVLVESHPGEGAAFTLELSSGRAGDPPDAPPPA